MRTLIQPDDGFESPDPLDAARIERRTVSERSVADLLTAIADGMPVSARSGHHAIATGFVALDRALGGGLHVGDLAIVGGLPGAGKTITTLQWARNMAMSGNQVLYLCWEHGVAGLLGRLLAMEVGSLDIAIDAIEAAAVDDAVNYVLAGGGGPGRAALDQPVVRAALARMATYADDLVLAHAGVEFDLDAIIARSSSGEVDAVFVDYLQKIPSAGPGREGVDRSIANVEGLKNLALDAECLVVAVSAVDGTALRQRRVAMDGLRDAHVVAHEADVIVTLNDKLAVVSRSHLAFDATLYERFSREVVFSIEKNRRGAAPVHVEFDKDFARFRLDPRGRFVGEKLIDGVTVIE